MLGVGIIGAGLQGNRRAQALRHLESNIQVVADINEMVAARLAKEVGCEATSSWENVISRKDVAALLVCTPHHLHAPISIAALKAGKHVLCEKPMGRNLEEAKSIVETAKRTGMRLKCGLNHRYHPAIRKAKEWVDAGVIGDIKFVRCRYGIGGRPAYDQEWRAKPEISGGGQLMDQGFHLLDLCRWFLGEFSEAFGIMSTYFWDIAPLEDNVFALLRTAKNQVASLHASWTQWKNLFSFEVFGQDGYAIIEGLGGSYGTERAILGKRSFTEPFREEITEFRDADRSWELEWSEFATCIAEDKAMMGSGSDALEVHELASAIYKSVHNECLVSLETEGGH